jgi:hypothetical protein
MWPSRNVLLPREAAIGYGFHKLPAVGEQLSGRRRTSQHGETRVSAAAVSHTSQSTV